MVSYSLKNVQLPIWTFEHDVRVMRIAIVLGRRGGVGSAIERRARVGYRKGVYWGEREAASLVSA